MIDSVKMAVFDIRQQAREAMRAVSSPEPDPEKFRECMSEIRRIASIFCERPAEREE